ncbi:YbgI/family dinuclear metal center protein [Rhinocladiella mackenziei CBS 650.93]|uniref:YbgI/family dinuclear metal center protein n=1 Tax=Rhinocladiella mackenziei CBS 650.93 TaxID=1442369 RepID=A0A0D2GR18_9EURO|nr:YbgI/family dinuclear metal center protein [Rhinocladiella mackenziei CBS 650.93]KIX00768.1 YbgI/family dinuclear metal center protein [Rhinocladiella mackenziei CBS 650.93]
MFRHLLRAIPRLQPQYIQNSIPIVRQMSTVQTPTVSPFTTAVVSSMRRLYPEVLADKSFDNTGLLVEAPFVASRPRNRNSVLLTVDLTRAVADEAIENKHSVVVAYHPIIFRGLKSFTTGDTQQLSMALLLAHGISVYCPHTAVDIVPDGMADWLCDIVTGKMDAPEPEADSRSSTKPTSLFAEGLDQDKDALSDPFTTPTAATKSKHPRPPAPHRTYSKPTYLRPTSSFHAVVVPHTRSVVVPSPPASLEAANKPASILDTNSPKYTPFNTGAGRFIEFASPQPLTVLITRIAHAIGLPKGFAVAIPQGRGIENIQIATVATCPGSGASVLRSCHADLIFTGELSHHDALAVTERGGCVIALFHSNSERGYLWSVMRERLEKEVKSEWERVRSQNRGESGKNGVPEQITEMLDDDSVGVVVSQRDRDPYGIVVLDETAVESHGMVCIATGNGDEADTAMNADSSSEMEHALNLCRRGAPPRWDRYKMTPYTDEEALAQKVSSSPWLSDTGI